MYRVAIALTAALLLLVLGCRSIEAPPPRTPVPTLEATRTPVPSATATPPPSPTPGVVGVFEPSDLPEFEDAEGAPHSGASLAAALSSDGLAVGDAGRAAILSVCSTGFDSFPDGAFVPRFTVHTIAVGDEERSVVIGVIIYTDARTRSEDWHIDARGRASINEDGICAERASVSFTGGSSPAFDAFFFGGFDEASAIGHANVVVTFSNAVFGGITLGGNGLDPEMRAEVERLIRGLREE